MTAFSATLYNEGQAQWGRRSVDDHHSDFTAEHFPTTAIEHPRGRFPMRTIRASAPLAAVIAAVCLLAPVHAQDAQLDDGLFITVPNPITGESVGRIKSSIDQAVNRDVSPVRKIVLDFTPEGHDAATRDFGICYDLAKFLQEQRLNGITTIAFVHGKVTRHTVLPILACSELVMSEDAKIGQVIPQGEPLPPETELRHYADQAGPAREALVLKMLDKNIDVLKGRTQDGSVRYIRAEDRDRFGDEVVGLESMLPPGQVELYTADQARDYGLASTICNTRQEVAAAYNLTPGSLREDPLDGKKPDAWRIVVRGRIDKAMKETLTRRISNVIGDGGNMIFLQLECSGGDTSVARELADQFRALERDQHVMTVAYIPSQAPDTATILAMGCSEIVMYKGNPETGETSTIGDFSAYFQQVREERGPDRNLNFLSENLAELADEQGYPPILFQGMVDPDLVIYRVRGMKDATRRTYMSKEAFENGQENWIHEGTIKEAGELLTLDAARARELGIARHLTENDDIREAYALYGLQPSEVQEATPDWLDAIAGFLQKPPVAVLLVMIGIACLIIELKIPGFGLPGILSALCFVLFFWSQSQVSGQIIWLAVLLFLLGVALLMVEIFILPGFGVTGVSGIILLVAGLGLATVDKIPSTSEEWGDFSGTLLQYTLSIIVATFAAFIFARYLPNIPGANRLLLAPPQEGTSGEPTILPGTSEAVGLLGAIGVASTMLRPAGLAKFDDKFIDVVTDGSFIPAGTRIQVIEVEGTRIVVKEI